MKALHRFLLFLIVSLGLMVWGASLIHGSERARGLDFETPFILEMINAVSTRSISETIRDLQDDDALPGWDAGRSRYTLSPEIAIESRYLYQRFAELQLEVEYDVFTRTLFLYGGLAPGWHEATAVQIVVTNVVATLPGFDLGSDRVYIVCAHYDSISDDPWKAAPGADDNASGVAAVLEAARILSRYRFRHTLRFIAFSGEEQGLWGSAHYAQKAKEANMDIGGVINLDMVGYDSNGDRVMEIHSSLRPRSSALADSFISLISRYDIPLNPEKITAGALEGSDHSSFWDQGYPAILVIEDLDDFNPYYHSTDDVLAHVDVSFAAAFTKATVGTLAELGGLSEIHLPFVISSARRLLPVPFAFPVFATASTVSSTPYWLGTGLFAYRYGQDDAS